VIHRSEPRKEWRVAATGNAAREGRVFDHCGCCTVERSVGNYPIRIFLSSRKGERNFNYASKKHQKCRCFEGKNSFSKTPHSSAAKGRDLATTAAT